MVEGSLLCAEHVRVATLGYWGSTGGTKYRQGVRVREREVSVKDSS